MTDNQAAQIVETLEKIEKHLQAIDWKFWDIYQKFSKDDSNPSNNETPVTDVKADNELDTLAEIINESNKPVVKHTLKYPSIEILKNE